MFNDINSSEYSKLVLSNDSSWLREVWALDGDRVGLRIHLEPFTALLALRYGGWQNMTAPTVHSWAVSIYPIHATDLSQRKFHSLHSQCCGLTACLVERAHTILDENMFARCQYQLRKTCKNSATSLYFSSSSRLREQGFRGQSITYIRLIPSKDIDGSEWLGGSSSLRRSSRLESTVSSDAASRLSDTITCDSSAFYATFITISVVSRDFAVLALLRYWEGLPSEKGFTLLLVILWGSIDCSSPALFFCWKVISISTRYLISTFCA